MTAPEKIYRSFSFGVLSYNDNYQMNSNDIEYIRADVAQAEIDSLKSEIAAWKQQFVDENEIAHDLEERGREHEAAVDKIFNHFINCNCATCVLHGKQCSKFMSVEDCHAKKRAWAYQSEKGDQMVDSQHNYCGTCKYFVHQKTLPSSIELGECIRFPPSIKSNEANESDLWPQVFSLFSVCGEYKKGKRILS